MLTKSRMHALLMLAATLMGVTAIVGCKTNQANMNDAYTRAMEGREPGDLGLDSTIYARVRNQMTHGTMEVGGETVNVSSQWVKASTDAGAKREDLQRYNVVVGQFKQIFNAKSMRDRVKELGYDRCYIVETTEPYYFVVAAGFADAAEAVAFLRQVESDGNLKMKSPAPFILEPSQHRR